MYQGQWRSLAVAAPNPIGAMRDLTEAFHRSHEREYNFRRDEAPSPVPPQPQAIGMVPKAELARMRRQGDAAATSRRPVWFDADVGIDTPV